MNRYSDRDAMARGLTKQDAPFACVFFGFLVALLSLAVLFAWRLDLMARERLVPVSGSVEAVYTTNQPKAGPKLQIELIDHGRRRHLTQDDLSSEFPAVLGLTKGERVLALTAPDAFGRDLDWVWQLEHEGGTLFTVDDVLRFKRHEAERVRPLGLVAALVSIILISGGITLRIRTGSWRGAHATR